jgi:hypothetical protein
MPTITIEKGGPPGVGARPVRDEPFVRIGDILRIRRKNWPPRAGDLVELVEERESLDFCRVVEGEEIEQFRFSGPQRWADFSAIEQAFPRPRISSGNSPYTRDWVFAPLKVVIRDQDNPIRAVLSYEPVYPKRAKLAVPMPGQSVHRVYAAVGVLNSAIGQAYYRKYLGRPLSGDSAYAAILRQLPVAHQDHSPDELELAAQLAYQVITLYQAQAECRGRDFWQHILPLKRRLSWAIGRLLRLDEAEEEQLIQSVADLKPEDAHLANLAESWGARMTLPPIRLGEPEDGGRVRKLLERERTGTATESELAELDRLQLLSYWQGMVNTPLPSRLSLVSEVSKAEEHGRGPRTRPPFSLDQAS